MRRPIFAACPFLLLLFGCQPGPPIRVQVYWGGTLHRPARGSSFDWSDAASYRPAAGRGDEAVFRTIRETVEAELAAIGFQKRSESAPPDLLVAFRTGRGLEPSPRGPEDRATLLIDIYSASDHRLIYRAWADAAINSSLPPEERTARLNYAVREILKPLKPPK